MKSTFSNNLRRCKKCLLPETHETISFNEEGICNICQAIHTKSQINWDTRLIELDKLVNNYKNKYRYDCIIPFSGGKDSTWTLYYLKKRYPSIKPLVVRFNHGFLRPILKQNSEKVFRKLGVDVHDFTPNWQVVKRLMLQSLLEKGDFCWHCHTGIFAYPMQVAIKEKVPLLFWGEPSAEYTAYFNYDNPEEVDEERFNRYVNLGISAEDMMIRLDGLVDERELEPFKYPPMRDLRELNYRSVCLGSFIPWDVKKQVNIIKSELGWEGDMVENVPSDYDYEKIECWMQGVRDYIKFLKRGYTRPSHLSAIDLRNNRISISEAKRQIIEFEGKKPPSLKLFLEYVGITEKQFNDIILTHVVSPWEPNLDNIIEGKKTNDFETWLKGDGLKESEAAQQMSNFNLTCSECKSDNCLS